MTSNRDEVGRKGDRKKWMYKNAVGLVYGGRDDETPSVSVKGSLFSADELVRIAQRYGVAVVERKEVAQGLMQLQEGQEIPEALYEAVAVIINNLENE